MILIIAYFSVRANNGLKTDKTVFLNQEVFLDAKKAHFLRKQDLKNQAITQKRNTPAFHTEVFQLELMTRIELVNLILTKQRSPQQSW